MLPYPDQCGSKIIRSLNVECLGLYSCQTVTEIPCVLKVVLNKKNLN